MTIFDALMVNADDDVDAIHECDNPCPITAPVSRISELLCAPPLRQISFVSSDDSAHGASRESVIVTQTHNFLFLKLELCIPDLKHVFLPHLSYLVNTCRF